MKKHRSMNIFLLFQAVLFAATVQAGDFTYQALVAEVDGEFHPLSLAGSNNANPPIDSNQLVWGNPLGSPAIIGQLVDKTLANLSPGGVNVVLKEHGLVTSNSELDKTNFEFNSENILTSHVLVSCPNFGYHTLKTKENVKTAEECQETKVHWLSFDPQTRNVKLPSDGGVAKTPTSLSVSEEAALALFANTNDNWRPLTLDFKSLDNGSRAFVYDSSNQTPIESHIEDGQLVSSNEKRDSETDDEGFTKLGGKKGKGISFREVFASSTIEYDLPLKPETKPKLQPESQPESEPESQPESSSTADDNVPAQQPSESPEPGTVEQPKVEHAEDSRDSGMGSVKNEHDSNYPSNEHTAKGDSTSIEEPVVTSKEEPVVTSKEEPVVTSKKEPVVTSKKEPVVTSKKEPVVTSKEEPVVTSKAEPENESKTSGESKEHEEHTKTENTMVGSTSSAVEGNRTNVTVSGNTKNESEVKIDTVHHSKKPENESAAVTPVRVPKVCRNGTRISGPKVKVSGTNITTPGMEMGTSEPNTKISKSNEEKSESTGVSESKPDVSGSTNVLESKPEISRSNNASEQGTEKSGSNNASEQGTEKSGSKMKSSESVNESSKHFKISPVSASEPQTTEMSNVSVPGSSEATAIAEAKAIEEGTKECTDCNEGKSSSDALNNTLNNEATHTLNGNSTISSKANPTTTVCTACQHGSQTTVWKTYTDYTTYCPQETTLTITKCGKVCVPSTMTVAAASTLTVTGVCIVPETTTVKTGKEHSEEEGRLNGGGKSEQKVNVEDIPSQKDGQKVHDQKDSVGQNEGSKPSEVQASNQSQPKSSEVKAENNAKGEDKSGNSGNGTSKNGNGTSGNGNGTSRNGNGTSGNGNGNSGTSGNGNGNSRTSGNEAKASTTKAGPNSTAKPTVEPFVNAASKNALGACVLGFAALLL